MTQVVSSISGLQVYAPSAGYAPTNNADVSAIASGYQVVSSTATQLYAGTAYLTSVNDAPVSASRAGNAANAGMANSAYYDGTGRLISSLPDSAAVSAIASSYAESAASGKQDALTFAYDDDKISSINGSALAGGGGVTGDYVETSALVVSIGSENTASSNSITQGSANSAIAIGCSFGSHSKASNRGFAQGIYNIAFNNSIAQGQYNSASACSFAQGTRNTASATSFAHGHGISSVNKNTVFGTYNLRGDGDTATGNSAAFAIGDGTASGARHDLMLVTKDGEITMYSSTADTVGTGIMSSIRAISAAATGGGVDSATVSAIASSYAESAVSSKLDESATADFYSTSNPSSFVDSAYVASAVSGKLDSSATADFYSTSNPSSFVDSAYVDSAVSSKLDSSASSSFYSIDNPSGFITGIDLSNYATTAYVDSSVSSKLDSSASSSFYTTANESGFVGSAYVDSALSSYALSADVSGTIDLVSTQSANWGGSALQLSAGPGVSLEKVGDTLVAGLALSAGPGVKLDQVGDTLVASTDETVLWSGTLNTLNSDVSCSESIYNFDRIKVFYRIVADSTLQSVAVHEFEPSEISSTSCVSFGSFYLISNGWYGWWLCRLSVTDNNKIKITKTLNSYGNGASPSGFSVDSNNIGFIYKIVGINRTAEV